MAEEIGKRLEEKVKYSEIAVLYRTSLDARTLSETLSEYQIPFVMKRADPEHI